MTRNLPPLTGGMERLNWHLAHELSRSFDVFVCGPDGCQNYLPPEIHVGATFASQPVSRFLTQSLRRGSAAARNIKPDLLIAGSGVTAPHVLLASRLTNTPMLVYLHGLDLVADHPLYRWGFLPCIRRCQGALVNSHHTARLAEQAGIGRQRIHVLHPGVTLPANLEQIDTRAFRAKLGVGNRPILLSVGRLTERKGLQAFIRHALPSIARRHPDVLLLVVGGEATERLGASRPRVGDSIAKEAANRGLTKHIRLLGRIDDATLAQAYVASQLHVFPVLDLPGDVEGFGMVAAEAAAHGLPTICFRSGGVGDAVAAGRSGLLVEPTDYTTMAKAIIAFINGDYPSINPEACRNFAAQLSWTIFGERLRNICLGYMQR